ncbi:MAG: hypothetical protein M1514_00650 [Patescibacteria group bacterium]|nr:hypothetical protein [Patescibacteria group bacterium]
MLEKNHSSFLAKAEKTIFLLGSLFSSIAIFACLFFNLSYITKAAGQTPTLSLADFPDYSVIPIVFVPKDQTVPEQNSIAQIDSWIKFVQAWYAARLDSRTFTYLPIQIYHGKYLTTAYDKPLYKADLKVQFTYYNVISELKEAGYPVGGAKAVKHILLVFYQGRPQNGYVALGAREFENINMSFLSLPYLSPLFQKNVFKLDVNYTCPFYQVDCRQLNLLGTFAHEMTHTIGDLPDQQEANAENSVIGNGSLFPHIGFSQTPQNPEKTAVASSPFINKTMVNLPSPLSLLGSMEKHLSQGWNLISLPIDFPNFIQPNTKGGILKIIKALKGSCEKVEILKPNAVKPEEMQTFSCSNPGVTDTLISPGEGIWIKMTKEANLVLWGLKFQPSSAIALKKGWNLVGPPWYNYNLSVEDSFKAISKDLEIIYAYNGQNPQNPWQKYNFQAPPFLNNLKSIESNQGYWIKAKKDTLWTTGEGQVPLLAPQSKGLGSYALPK